MCAEIGFVGSNIFGALCLVGLSGFELNPHHCHLPVSEEVQPDRNIDSRIDCGVDCNTRQTANDNPSHSDFLIMKRSFCDISFVPFVSNTLPYSA